MFRSLLTLAAASGLGMPLAAQAYDQLPRGLAELTPVDFARTVRISDEAADSRIVLSTAAGYTRARSVKGARADDVHLRAVIDRATGRVTWRVWHEFVHVSAHKDVVAVRYTDGGAQRTAAPFALDHRLDLCPATDGVGMCSKYTRVGFDLPDHVIRQIAASYRPGSRAPWQLHFVDAFGGDVTGGLAPAEAAGLLEALDAWRDGPAKRA